MNMEMQKKPNTKQEILNLRTEREKFEQKLNTIKSEEDVGGEWYIEDI